MELESLKETNLEEYKKNEKLFVMTLGFIVLFVSSCASVYTGDDRPFDITKISASEKTNGFVVTISATRKIADVEAWIGDNNWLYITIADTNVNLAQIMSLENSPLFVKTEYFKMNEVIQLDLQMKYKVDQLDVVRYPDDNDVYIALYKFKI